MPHRRWANPTSLRLIVESASQLPPVQICRNRGAITTFGVSTPRTESGSVDACFVATAAYGTPMAHDIRALRRLRDRHLRTHAIGRALVAIYETVGPSLADGIRAHPSLRAAARAVLRPLVWLASP